MLSLTLTPVLSSYLLKPKASKHAGGDHADDAHAQHDAHDTWLIRKLKKPYLRLLELSLNNGRKTVAVAVAVFFATGALMPFLGTAFIPEMKEGSIVPGINRVPNISLEESVRMEMEAMRLVMQVPGVRSAVSGVGRGESPADPQGQNESTPIVSLKPRDQWPKGWTQDDIAEGMRRALQALPGVQIVMAQPISDRVDEMVTGVRSDVAIKVFGDDLAVLREKAEAIARVAQGIQGAQDMRVERITGQQYLQIAIDRQAIARHGLNASDVHNVIETAIGGKEATEIFEGERRFGAVVRLPEAYRGSVEAIRNLIVAAPNGAQVPLESLARIEVTDGPAQISRELGKRRVVVGVNVRDRDLGGFVAELQAAVAQKVKLPEGYSLEWAASSRTWSARWGA